MNPQSNNLAADVQSKLQAAKTLCLDLLMPSATIEALCTVGHKFRDCAYTPMVVVWMFITQVLAADHSCQQAVARLNAWRIAQGLTRVSSETTSYCKARLRLPVKLFKQLLSWTASNAKTYEAWLFHDRVVEMVDGWTVTMADTAKNQRAYPQMACHKPGCGFHRAHGWHLAQSRTWPLVPTRANRQSSLLRRL